MASPATAILSLLGTSTRIELHGERSYTVGRSRDASLPVRDPRCSRRQFEIHPIPTGWQLVPISQDNPTELNGRSISAPASLNHGDRIRAGDSVFEFLAMPMEGQDQKTIRAGDIDRSFDLGQWLGKEVAIGNGLLIGRDPSCNLILNHPLVSRRHAHVVRRDGDFFVVDLVSANGTFVNGRSLNAGRHSLGEKLVVGDRIDIGPYSLRFTGSHLAPTSRVGNIDLQGRGLTRIVTDRSTGLPLKLLDDVTIRIRPGQFVCLLGPSGSGKSTLLAALSGRAKPDRGQVMLNSLDLYESFEVVKRELAVVPQKDLLFDALTVSEALTYTARLRLPADSSAADVQREVDELIDTVGLSAKQQTPIRQLSGGQLKRVSLANELMGRPSLIFLDEVTSGLDEQTDREMMALFRKMADAGKTVVCVTHSLANVDRYCHGVVALAPGGVLAFSGSPEQAKHYFGVERLGDLYEALGSAEPDSWRSKFESHPNAATRTDQPMDPEPNTDSPKDGVKATAKEAIRQGSVLCQRRVRLLFRDRPALLTLALQTAIVAAALGIVYGDLSRVENGVAQARDAVTLYFLLGVSSFWFGCNGTVKVLVADRPMYRRERAVNLSPWAYGGSTFLVYCGITVSQTITLGMVVWGLCQPPGMGWGVIGILALASAAGAALGLALSAGAESEEQAVASVPLALIPQIVFGGAIVKLGGFAEYLARIGITSYWAQKANLTLLPAEVADRAGVDRSGGAQAIGMLFVHLSLYALAATLVVFYRDSRTSRR